MIREFFLFLAAGIGYGVILAFSQAFGTVIATFLKDFHPQQERHAPRRIDACVLFGISPFIVTAIVGIFGFGGFFFREKLASTITLISLLYVCGTFFAIKTIIDEESNLKAESPDRFKLAMQIGLFFVFILTWIHARAIVL